MRSSRIYVKASLESGNTLELSKSQSHYVTNVLRLKPGDQLSVFNGDGGEYASTIKTLDKRHAIIQLDQFIKTDIESPLRIHLGQGIARGERMDWILQKSVELGVADMTPLSTQRSNVKIPNDRRESRLQHWQAVVSSACEQTGRNTVPAVHDIKTTLAWLQHTDAELKLVLHHRAEQAISTLQAKPASVALFIGPEGGLTKEEIAIAKQCGFQSIQMGLRVLRTETASLTAIAALQTLFGDF